MTCVDAHSETGQVSVSFVGSGGQVEGELRHLWNSRFEDVTPVRGFSHVGVGSNPYTTARLLSAVGVMNVPALLKVLRDYQEGRRTAVARIGRWPLEAFPAGT